MVVLKPGLLNGSKSSTWYPPPRENIFIYSGSYLVGPPPSVPWVFNSIQVLHGLFLTTPWLGFLDDVLLLLGQHLLLRLHFC